MLGLETNRYHKPPNPHIINWYLNTIEFAGVDSKRDCVDGSNVNGVRKSLLTFDLCKPPGFKILCEPETMQNGN